MLTLNQMTLARGNKILLEQATVTLFEKQKVGLVGRNGCGKSSFFSLVLGKLTPDAGECQLNAQLRISHLSQDLPDSESSAVDYVLAGDLEYAMLLKKLTAAENTGDDATIVACHDRMSQTGAYSKPALAASILAGLGFSTTAQQSSVNSFSGGWRMRLNLARCLMTPAELLLLDEPTNHLDMEAIFWLERWLKQSPATVIVISHDREFLDALVTHILHFDQQRATLYTGNYSRFERSRAEAIALQQAAYTKQQTKINHMMDYVNRFKAKASKAKQAQSRLKAIEKMDIIAKAQIDSPFTFEFYPCPKAGKPLIRCEDASVGYDPKRLILNKVNLSLNPGDRFALLGPNGEGKSTFIKALTGDLPPKSGRIERSPHLQVGYFAQHQLEDLDCALSPVQTILQLTPDVREQTVRDFLGGFNFVGDMALAPIHYFSGGEKARLALAKLVWLRPNLLLLDEPTNHLDLEMRSAIEIALQSYEGALIVISHDRHFLRTTVDDFYLVYDQNIKPFDGDVDAYHQWLLNQATPAQIQKTAPSSDYREKKSQQNRLKKLEQTIESYQAEIKTLEIKLADSSLYLNSEAISLKELTEKRGKLVRQLTEAEEEWLELMELLEH
ncbi:ABC-F family ATP-binding cassette domain-containing protein [Legionella yabuuchiae]|uniref:ABC-F family ATP-binding cassette domain-containing protein n=1 Tax=Legionella yabuuchiae TaxID=376727 RepID=UPI0010553082|nr:ATP-binding cassette domain-containing protein [Legionella yabuuchiae]